MNFFISLTHKCQLRCSYCYAGDKFSKSISYETIDATVEFILSKVNSSFGLGFFGGEPLMEWEKLKYATTKLEEHASKRGIEFTKTVTTNGVELTAKKIDWLIEHNFFVVVSLDGNANMHNTHRVYGDNSESFSEITQNIALVQRYFNPSKISTNTVVTPQNVAFLSESIKFLHDKMNIEKIRVSIDYFSNWEDIDIVELEFKKLKEYVLKCYRDNRDIFINIVDEKIEAHIQSGCIGCSFGEYKIGIAPSGTLYPCERLIGEDTGELAIGNVFSGFNSQALANTIASRGNKNVECKDCEFESRCANSCGCTNFYLTGDIAKTNGVLCYFQKLIINTADEIASRLYSEKNELFMKKFYSTS